MQFTANLITVTKWETKSLTGGELVINKLVQKISVQDITLVYLLAPLELAI